MFLSSSLLQSGRLELGLPCAAKSQSKVSVYWSLIRAERSPLFWTRGLASPGLVGTRGLVQYYWKVDIYSFQK